MHIPKVERRKNRPSRNQGGGFDMPRSAGGFILRRLRPSLPIKWQYGWRWQCVKGLYLGVGLAFVAKLAYTMFFQLSDEEIDRKAAKYTYVRNDQGTVVDVAYKPLLDAGIRARRRTARLLEEDEE